MHVNLPTLLFHCLPADIPTKLAHPISRLAEPLFKYTAIVQLCSNCTLTFKMGMP